MQVDRPSLLSSHSEPESAPLMYITHKLTINAVHRLWSNSLSEANNSDTYGTGLSLHGHTYKFSVTFRGPLCKATGQIYAAALLEDCVKLAITEVMDRKNLDTDISWFQNRPSTLENVAMFVWRNVAVILTPHPHDVEEVRVKTDGCARDRESSGRIDCVVASYRGGMIPISGAR